ncbi:MAG: PEP-CTERM sorting domain-containing protein [Fimbriimonadales bacterium]|nr:PEP-CTERM sorting domain-containing protein [Fimbriimonadales bacterium]
MRAARMLSSSVAMAALIASAQYMESEPNDSRAQANYFFMSPGEWIEGTSTGSTGSELDYFRVQTVSAAPAIYRYRLILTSDTAGHTGEIRGQGQTAATPGPWPGPVGTGSGVEGLVQRSSTTTNPPRFVQWYGFGRQEQIYYRVFGTSSTTAPYRATLERLEIIPTDLGIFQPGTIAISTIGGTTLNTELWIYDAGFNAIPGYGNDDESADGGGTGATTQSLLVRQYAPGVYYLALTRFSMANEHGSPCDDDFRTGAMLFPENAGAVLSSAATSSPTAIGFTFTDSAGVHNFSASGIGPYEILWYRFEVVPEPSSLLALVAGAVGLLGIRHRSR